MTPSPAQPPTAAPLLTVAGLRVVLGGRTLLRDVHVAFGPGLHAVIGRSGAGKSVLLKAVCGLLPAAAGRVRCTAPPLLYVHQDPALLPDRSVWDNVLLPITSSARAIVSKAAQRDDVHGLAAALLLRLGLLPLARRRPTELTPAQQRRVALARGLLLSPGVLIVDEPTTGLDPFAAADVDQALVDVIAGASDAGSAAHTGPRCLIVVTHHPRTLAHLRPRVVEVTGGAVVERGAAHSVTTEATPADAQVVSP